MKSMTMSAPVSKVIEPQALVDRYSIVGYDETLTNTTPTGAFLNNNLKNPKTSFTTQVLIFTFARADVTTTGKFPGLNAARGEEYIP